MNRILNWVAVFLLLTALGCKKNAPGPQNVSDQLPDKAATYNGKIIAVCCGQIVVQTSGDNKFGKINWNNGATTYDHVFTAANYCQLADLKEGSSFKFKIIDDTPQNCAVCLGILPAPPPDLKYSIEVMGK